MGANFKQMDDHFRKQLKNYSQSAPNEIWGNIEQVLDEKLKSRRIAIYKFAAAVAAFAILGSGFLYLSNTKKQLDQNNLIVENASQLKFDNKTESIEPENTDKQEVLIQSQSEKKEPEADQIIANVQTVKKVKTISHEILLIEDQPEQREEHLEKLIQKQIAITEEALVLSIIDTRGQDVKSYLKTLPDIYTSYALNDLLESKETKKTKWILGGEFSPLYSYRHITETRINSYSKEIFNDTENPILSYTGGLNIQYKALGRFSIQAGVYYTTMGQSLDYMSVYTNSAYNLIDEQYKDRFVSSYAIANSSGDLTFNSPYVIVDKKSARVNNLAYNKAQADVSDPIYNKLDAEIQQSFQYVEVPVLMRYKLIDRKIDLNIVGGMGANFLVGNDVILKYGSNKEIIGDTEGVNSVNYNGTLGFGIEYPIMDKLNIRFEPSVKYYINEINSSSSVESHPYSIGIYTGINYSF